MSLWFSSPAPTTTSPSESRQLGFGQVVSLGPAFTVGAPEEDSPMSSAAGGITQNFSSRNSVSANLNNEFNFDGPHFYNNPLTFTNNVNNNINQNFFLDNIFQWVPQSTPGSTTPPASFACSDLGSCGGTNTSITVLTSASLGGSGLVFTRRVLTFNVYGLLTSDVATTNTTISTVACS